MSDIRSSALCSLRASMRRTSSPVSTRSKSCAPRPIPHLMSQFMLRALELVYCGVHIGQFRCWRSRLQDHMFHCTKDKGTKPRPVLTVCDIIYMVHGRWRQRCISTASADHLVGCTPKLAQWSSIARSQQSENRMASAPYPMISFIQVTQDRHASHGQRAGLNESYTLNSRCYRILSICQ